MIKVLIYGPDGMMLFALFPDVPRPGDELELEGAPMMVASSIIINDIGHVTIEPNNTYMWN